MKHIFIANPTAGRVNSVPFIREEVAKIPAEYDCEVHETTGKGDATAFVRSWCEAHPDEKVRFYACGGDGTLNDVLTGMIGFPNASLSCYPCGSGNDFVKYYGGADRFLSFDALVKGEEEEIDVATDGNRYSINVADFGFDYAVCATMAKVKRKPIIGGKHAYTSGVAHALFHAMKNRARVLVDGKEFGPDTILLCTVANGNYVGGAYKCAPRSDNKDGLLEVCIATPLSIFRFLKLISAYKRGEHLDDPRFADCILYTRGKTVEVTADKDDFGYALDGELVKSRHFTISVLPRAVRFAVPPVAEAQPKAAE